MKRAILIFTGFLLIAGVYILSLYYRHLRGAGPAFFDRTPPADIAEIIEKKNSLPPGENDTEFPLTLSDGFLIEVFARDLGKPRVMAFDREGNMWVSRTRDGVVTKLEVKNGRVKRQRDVFIGLNNPHGLAFDIEDPNILYIAEEHRISRVRVYPSVSALEPIIDLPDVGGVRGHFTRTIKFGPDDRLYVSIGSSCNVCEEDHPWRTSIVSMNKDGSDARVYARGLRNAVFFDWSYIDGHMWATEMGRDQLGDDLPPDEINIIKEDGFYGWPWYYGKNIRDNDYRSRVAPSLAYEPVPSHIDMPAHVAPLGLGFVPEEGWPEDMWHDLLVAEHGSWNRSVPVGYKIVRLKLDERGEYMGMEDFISGWLTEDNKALGRPVDLLVQPGGLLYISDDRAGVIYKVTYQESASEGECIVTGCSSQVCSLEEVITTCEFKPHYACYKDAVCERQESGECGWTETEDLRICLEKNGLNPAGATLQF